MEALVAMAILAFVIVTILGGFSQQQVATRKTATKNTALILAEMRLEELLKFPASQLVAPGVTQVTTDFIISRNNTFQYFDDDPGDMSDPGKPTRAQMDQFRRTTRIQGDLLGDVATIQVMVEYGRTVAGEYAFRVVMASRRSL